MDRREKLYGIAEKLPKSAGASLPRPAVAKPR